MSFGALTNGTGRGLSRRVRIILALSFGTIFTLLVFWVIVGNKVPWQLNYLLAPGAVPALILGFVTRYGDPWYGLTLLAANALFYGLLAYVLLRIILGRVSKVPRP
jgi:predicted neutral ceramidase superfamily lipid hydrolase